MDTVDNIFTNVFSILPQYSYQLMDCTDYDGIYFVYYKSKHLVSVYYQVYEQQDRIDIYTNFSRFGISSSKYFSKCNTSLSMPDRSLICYHIRKTILEDVETYDTGFNNLALDLKLNLNEVTLFDVDDFDFSKLNIKYIDAYTKEQINAMLQQKGDKIQTLKYINDKFDLSQYYTKDQIDDLLSQKMSVYHCNDVIKKMSKDQFYTKPQIDIMLSGKVKLQDLDDLISTNVYNKEEISGLLQNKLNKSQLTTLIQPNLSAYYTKEELSGILDDKVNKSDMNSVISARYYDKDTLDNKLDQKINTEIIESSVSSQINQCYTREEVDALLRNKITKEQCVKLLSGYYTKEDLNNKLVSANYATEQSMDTYVNDKMKSYYTNAQLLDVLANYYVSTDAVLAYLDEITYTKAAISALIVSEIRRLK